MNLKESFPKAGEEYLGGQSDGWEYRSVFAGSSLEQSYEMLRQFLIEEGFSDIPLPATATDLAMFRQPKNGRQSRLFEEYAYVHNPIKIFFPRSRRKIVPLELRVYNTAAPDHLMRFHGHR